MNPFTWLGKAMGDGENPSATRLVVVWSLLLNNSLPMIVWSHANWHATASFLDMPGALLGFVASLNTLMLGALHLNKREETKTEIKP